MRSEVNRIVRLPKTGNVHVVSGIRVLVMAESASVLDPSVLRQRLSKLTLLHKALLVRVIKDGKGTSLSPQIRGRQESCA